MTPRTYWITWVAVGLVLLGVFLTTVRPITTRLDRLLQKDRAGEGASHD